MNNDAHITILSAALEAIGADFSTTMPDGDGLGGYIELVAGEQYTTIYFDDDGSLRKDDE